MASPMRDEDLGGDGTADSANIPNEDQMSQIEAACIAASESAGERQESDEIQTLLMSGYDVTENIVLSGSMAHQLFTDKSVLQARIAQLVNESIVANATLISSLSTRLNEVITNLQSLQLPIAFGDDVNPPTVDIETWSSKWAKVMTPEADYSAGDVTPTVVESATQESQPGQEAAAKDGAGTASSVPLATPQSPDVEMMAGDAEGRAVSPSASSTGSAPKPKTPKGKRQWTNLNSVHKLAPQGRESFPDSGPAPAAIL